MNKKFILASQSPRRRSLLKKLNIEFSVVSPDYDEKIDNDDFSEKKIEYIAEHKALSILDKIDDCILISADTVVVLNNKILGKPKDENDAFTMLKKLSGNTHKVVTSVFIADKYSKKSYTSSTTSYVTFNALTDMQIQNYVKTCNPLDKAGAYGIQELDDTFINKVEGSFDNIVGLPTETLADMLSELGQ